MTRSAARNVLAGLSSAVLGFCGGCGWHAASQTCCSPGLYPLGAVNQAHYEAMHVKGQASAFVIHQFEFMGTTGELSAAGKDHLLEIASHARSAPFPIIVERTDNNANPSLDERRRASVAQVLVDLGIADAIQRTVVAPVYDQSPVDRQADADPGAIRE